MHIIEDIKSTCWSVPEYYNVFIVNLAFEIKKNNDFDNDGNICRVNKAFSVGSIGRCPNCLGRTNLFRGI